MHVLPVSLALLFACLAALGSARNVDRSAHHGFAILDAAGDATLDEGVATSPFCQKLCNKSNIEDRDAKTCKDLGEDDCKTLNFYRKNGGELRLCVWQPQWKCTEDWTTVCISKGPWTCNSQLPKLSLCESICYKTDVRSIDTFCRKLSLEECSSDQFYESDRHGHRRLCELQAAGGCAASSLCPADKTSCPGSTLFDAGTNLSAEGSTAECRSMCYKTNTVVSGLSCRDLTLAHCSSGQFYETDWHGVRHLCVPEGAECVADPSKSCPGSVPLCWDSQTSVRPPTNGTTAPSLEKSANQTDPDPEVPAMSQELQVPAFCLSLCEKTNTRSMNASCGDLPAASCESEEFYETDHEGTRRLCLQQAGKCLTNLTAACEARFPICSASTGADYLDSKEDSEHCFLYCDKINTRSRSQSCESLSSSECLSGIFYESDHDGNRLMCSYSQGCMANISTTCKADQPICHGVEGAKPKAQPVVRSSRFAVHSSGNYGSASPAASEAFGGPPVTPHSGARGAESMAGLLTGLALRSIF